MPVFVPGLPRPQGSLKYVGHRAGKPVLTSTTTDLHAWRDKVGWAVKGQLRGQPPAQGAVILHLTFFLKPPQRAKPGQQAIAKPDLDKLVRALLDSCTRVIYNDDSQVVEIHAIKRYAFGDQQPGVLIEWTHV